MVTPEPYLTGGPGLWVLFVLLVPLVLLLIPWVFFLLNLRALLGRVHPQNRAMSPDEVWLNFIPLFNLGWFIYTVVKIRDSVRAEYHSRQWLPHADLGYNVGLAAGILWICAAFLWWVPFVGWAVVIAWLVCWIIYWLKTADLKRQFDLGARWSGPGAPPPYAGYGPAGYAGPGYGPQGGGYRPPVPGYGPPVYGPPPGGPWPQQSPSGPGAPTGGPGAPPSGLDAPAVAGKSQTPRCAVCGTNIAPEDKFCRTCGLPLP